MVFELLDGRVCRAKNSKKARGQFNKIFTDLILVVAAAAAWESGAAVVY